MTDLKLQILSRQLVIIESPFNGPTPEVIEYNKTYARRAVHDSVHRGEAPIASHLLFTQTGILDDADPDERMMGILAGLAWHQAKVIVAVYSDLGISSGMKKGLEVADLMHTPIVYRTIGRNPDDAS